jgi:catechol 2,3-dioxygenase-like lactoylglutathione lyase family enzyme
MAVPGVVGILETSLYVANVQSSVTFYQSLFDFPVLLNLERIASLRVNEGQVLLLFKQGASTGSMTSSEGTLPPHDGTGQNHMAFSIPKADFDDWQTRLGAHNIAIESIINWDSGSRSLYFRDPDGHLLELATPGIWEMRW